MAAAKGSGKAGASSPAKPTSPKPSVKVPMAWFAIGITVGCSPQIFEGLTISFPSLGRLNLIGKGDQNTLVAPLPKAWGEAIAANQRYVKIVSGKLPDLVLYKADEGDNTGIWSKYIHAHRQTGLILDDADWNPGRKLTKSG